MHLDGQLAFINSFYKYRVSMNQKIHALFHFIIVFIDWCPLFRPILSLNDSL